MRDQQKRSWKTSKHVLKSFDRTYIKMICRLVEHEKVRIFDKLLGEDQFAELARAQVVAIEQLVGVRVQPRHDGEDVTFNLLVLVSEMPQGSLTFL